MAWTRWTQTGFEFGTINELNFSAGIHTSDSVGTTYKVTGSRGATRFGSSSGGGMFLSSYTAQMMVNFLVYPNGGSFIEDQRLFEFYCPVSNQGNALFEFHALKTGVWRLYYRDPSTGTLTILDTAPLWQNGICTGDSYSSYGFTIGTNPANLFLSMYQNGEQILSYDGALLSGVAGVQGFEILRHSLFDGNNLFLGADDVVAWVGSGSEDDEVPSSPRFLRQIPTDNGSTNQWITETGLGDNYDRVYEAPANDDSFIYTLTSGHVDLMEVSTFVDVDFHDLQAVIPIARIKKGDAQKDSWLRFMARNMSTANIVYGGVHLSLPSDFEYFYSRITTDPNGDSWTAAGLNACEFGFESLGTL